MSLLVLNRTYDFRGDSVLRQNFLLLTFMSFMMAFANACGTSSSDESPGPLPTLSLTGLRADLQSKAKTYPSELNLSTDRPALTWIERIQLTTALADMANQAVAEPVIAVLDSGLDWDHPAFERRIVDTSVFSSHCQGDQHGCNTSSYQFPDSKLGDGDNFPVGTTRAGDRCPRGESAANSCLHGTHVAGIIAGYDPEADIYGVCPSCKILPIKVVSRDGKITDDAILAAFEYIAELKTQGLPIRVVNCSFGKYQSSERVNRAIQNLQQGAEDILVIAAAGNENTNELSFPAALSPAISVANVNSSNLVKDGRSDFGTSIGISAPVGSCSDNGEGYGVVSAIPGPSGGSLCLNGTSMAAPMVAGVAGLILSLHPELSAAELKSRILASADGTSLYAANPEYTVQRHGQTFNLLGSGLLNAAYAVRQQVANGSEPNPQKRVTASCGALGFSEGSALPLLLYLMPLLIGLGHRLYPVRRQRGPAR